MKPRGSKKGKRK